MQERLIHNKYSQIHLQINFFFLKSSTCLYLNCSLYNLFELQYTRNLMAMRSMEISSHDNILWADRG